MAATDAAAATGTAGIRVRPVGRRPERTVGGITALYEHEYRPLLRIAYGLTGSQSEAEELVQEAFVRCYQRWAKVEGYDNPGAWLRRVLLNLAASRGPRLAAGGGGAPPLRG